MIVSAPPLPTPTPTLCNHYAPRWLSISKSNDEQDYWIASKATVPVPDEAKMANRRTLLVDGALRMIGAMFLGCCVSRLVRLIRLVGAPPIHDPTPAEVTIAILCVGALFAGTILTMLGHHLFDRMDIPVRHRMTAFFDPASSDEADRGALPPQLLSPRPEPPAARAARRSITAMAPIGPR